jgi:hypothetical protein
MKIVYEYSHLGGSEILTVRYPGVSREIDQVIEAIQPFRNKISREKTMTGKALFSPIEMNKQFRQQFNQHGFVEIRDYFDIVLPGQEVPISRAFKQVDFARDHILIEVQFGKYPFMFYDLAKFQYFFNESKAEVGVEIVPCHALHAEMSTGVAYGEQLINDIERLKRHFPAVPVKVILIDA